MPPPIPENPNIRKGQFLWKEDDERRAYVDDISRKISSGYYYSDKVIGEIVDELAPVFSDEL
jgi:hypothetical protein